MTITPNIGHTEGQFSANYSIEPYKGITVDFQPPAHFHTTNPAMTSIDFPQSARTTGRIRRDRVSVAF